MDKSYWNNAAKTVRTSHPERQALNDLIGLELAKVRRAYIDHRLKGKEVNFSTIKNLFTVETQCTELLQLVETYNRESEISITRQRHIKTAYRHAIASGMPSIVEKIKSEHIKNLKKHLYKTLMKNTVLSVMKRLKSVFNFAVNNGVIEKPPMDGIVIGEFESKYGFLTVGDITRIATTLPDLSPDLIKVGKMFLFCCYTGLRFGDAINLKNCTVLETSHGRAIYFEAKKT